VRAWQAIEFQRVVASENVRGVERDVTVPRCLSGVVGLPAHGCRRIIKRDVSPERAMTALLRQARTPCPARLCCTWCMGPRAARPAGERAP